MSNGSLAYFTAGLGVVYDPSTHTQKFFDAHGDDVTAITFSPDKKFIASGENGKRPFVYIWDSETMEQKFALRDNGIKGNIQALAYSPSGKVLGVVDMSEDHNIALYDTTTGKCLVASKGDKACVLDIAF
jgi:WD40 repeat protein